MSVPNPNGEAATPSAPRALVTIVTPCFNESENVAELHARIKAVMEAEPYDWRHLFIDNASVDDTWAKIVVLCTQDKRVQGIRNTRNFGHIRSPYHGLVQAEGAAVIVMASDLQDPPELIANLLRCWEGGARTVVAVKTTTEEGALMAWVRRSYYAWVKSIADVELIENATGFGLYDRVVLDALAQIQDPYPYFRGLISEIGFKVDTVPYHQASRKRGFTKNNFFTLFDMAMLGMVKHSRVPLRLATLGGFLLSVFSLLAAAAYFVLKLLLWYQFPAGVAPVLIGVFFFSAVQLFFLGLIGEYVGMILLHVRNVPLVFELQRVNLPPKR